MDANACAGICVTRSIMSALILPSGESRQSPLDIFRSADESAGYILQSERPYERWGRAAGRSSDRHCTKDPYCPNCSLLQENLLNGSCRCFLLFFSSLSPHIFTTTATVFVVDVFFFLFFSKVFFVFSLSCLDSFFSVSVSLLRNGGDHVYIGGLTENAKRDDGYNVALDLRDWIFFFFFSSLGEIWCNTYFKWNKKKSTGKILDLKKVILLSLLSKINTDTAEDRFSKTEKAETLFPHRTT